MLVYVADVLYEGGCFVMCRALLRFVSLRLAFDSFGRERGRDILDAPLLDGLLRARRSSPREAIGMPVFK